MERFISAAAFFAVALLLAYPSKAQESYRTFQDPYEAVQLSDDFDQSAGRLTFYASNLDFCDYYLHIFFRNAEGFQAMTSSTSLAVSHGRQRMIKTYRVDEKATRYAYQYSYLTFRGTIYKKPNVDFLYSLPVVNEETIFAETVENQEGYQLAFELPTDTVYACRGGILCDDNLKDHSAKGRNGFNNSRVLSKVTVYHADGTFGEYAFMGKPIGYPGRKVDVGTPIAIVDESIGKYSAYFSAYFLDKNKVNHTNVGNKHTHFRPFFQTDNEEKIRLENGKTYTCKLTDEMRMQDMSRRERKNFLKSRAKADEKK
jgi:hypothetical protein